MSPEQLVEFAANFGPLDAYPYRPYAFGNPYVARFVTAPDEAGGQNVWHSDVTFKEKPLAKLKRKKMVLRILDTLHQVNLYLVLSQMDGQ